MLVRVFITFLYALNFNGEERSPIKPNYSAKF